MNIKGSRKMVMTVLIAGVVMTEKWTGPFSDAQVELLQTLILVAFAGNGIEHVAEVIKNAHNRRASAGIVSSVRPVTVQGQAPAGSKNSH